MTETQAKSGAAGGGSNPPADSGARAAENAGGEAPVAPGHAVVGRASVPESPSAKSTSDAGSSATAGKDKPKPGDSGSSAPKFTRAPGMPPPPDTLVPAQSADKGGATTNLSSLAPTSGGPVTATGVAVARASVPGAVSFGRPPTTSEGRPLGPISGGPVGATPGAPPGPGGPGGPGAATARVTEAIRGARATVSAAASRGPRRARLYLKRVDPWSVMKFAFAVSFVLFIVMIVATSVLYLALDQMKVFESVNGALDDMMGAAGGNTQNTFKINAKGVIVGAGLLGLVNVVLFTALATLSAFIYNVCSDLVGGIELTLAEKE